MDTTPYFKLGIAFPPNEVFIDILEDREIDLKTCSEISTVSYEALVAFTNGDLEALSSEQKTLIEESLKLPINYFARQQDFYDKHPNKRTPFPDVESLP